MRQSSQQLGNVPQKETEALIVRFALKWRKEKQRARLRTQLWNNVGILFSALSTFNNACTGHAHYIFSRLTHQANIAVMKLVCPGTIVSGCASPTFSVRLVKKKLVCNAVQAFLVICPCVSDLEKRKKWCILFLMSFVSFLNRHHFKMKKIKWQPKRGNQKDISTLSILNFHFKIKTHQFNKLPSAKHTN